MSISFSFVIYIIDFISYKCKNLSNSETWQTLLDTYFNDAFQYLQYQYPCEKINKAELYSLVLYYGSTDAIKP